MSAVVRHAWLQKHPTPAAARGEFHWYPPDRDRELRARVVERARGIEAPAIVWELAPGQVSWAQVFAATAPTDGRRYTGLVLTIAEGAGAPAALLDALAPPPGAPWSAPPIAPPIAPGDPSPSPPPSPAELAPHALAAIARGLLTGATTCVDEVASPALAHHVARLERLVPATVTRHRRAGAWVQGTSAAPDRVAQLLADACAHPASRAAQAWALLAELATARDATVDELVAGLGAAEDPLAPAERAAIGAPRDLAQTLHAWGRGRLDATPDASTLAERLADAVVRRVLADVLEGRDPARAIAEARWHALLPATRRVELLDLVAGRAPALRALVEGSHA